jgi:hypothetical protein
MMIEPAVVFLAGYFWHIMGVCAVLVASLSTLLFVSSPRRLNKEVDRFDPFKPFWGRSHSMLIRFLVGLLISAIAYYVIAKVFGRPDVAAVVGIIGVIISALIAITDRNPPLN